MAQSNAVVHYDNLYEISVPTACKLPLQPTPLPMDRANHRPARCFAIGQGITQRDHVACTIAGGDDELSIRHPLKAVDCAKASLAVIELVLTGCLEVQALCDPVVTTMAQHEARIATIAALEQAIAEKQVSQETDPKESDDAASKPAQVESSFYQKTAVPRGFRELELPVFSSYHGSMDTAVAFRSAGDLRWRDYSDMPGEHPIDQFHMANAISQQHDLAHGGALLPGLFNPLSPQAMQTCFWEEIEEQIAGGVRPRDSYAAVAAQDVGMPMWPGLAAQYMAFERQREMARQARHERRPRGEADEAESESGISV